MKVKKWNYTTSTYNECEIAYSIDEDTQETVTCACCVNRFQLKLLTSLGSFGAQMGQYCQCAQIVMI